MENILFYILITLIDSLYYHIDVAMYVTSHIVISLTLVSHTRVHITTHYTHYHHDHATVFIHIFKQSRQQSYILRHFNRNISTLLHFNSIL